MEFTADHWIKKFNMQKHPEGGYFRETYRSNLKVGPGALPVSFSGERSVSTAIYFLLEKNDLSKFHRLLSDEIWFFHCGSPLLIHKIDPDGVYSVSELGHGIFQEVLQGGTWFGAEVTDKSSYSLVSCTVSPGFDFRDFELARRDLLISRFPEQKDIITKLT